MTGKIIVNLEDFEQKFEENKNPKVIRLNGEWMVECDE